MRPASREQNCSKNIESECGRVQRLWLCRKSLSNWERNQAKRSMRTVIVRPPISAPFMICVAACASSGVEYLTVPKPLHMHTCLLTILPHPLDLPSAHPIPPDLNSHISLLVNLYVAPMSRSGQDEKPCAPAHASLHQALGSTLAIVNEVVCQGTP